jgi:hypothetical protein
MFKEILAKYSIKGEFTFTPTENFEIKCNAPTTQSGVYLIYKIIESKEELLYIGSSGQKTKDGKLKTRKSGLGGMKDRLANGYHPKFGKIKRKKLFPSQMLIENIPQIKIYWWVTYDTVYFDFPTDVEGQLRKLVDKLPAWHK